MCAHLIAMMDDTCDHGTLGRFYFNYLHDWHPPKNYLRRHLWGL